MPAGQEVVRIGERPVTSSMGRQPPSPHSNGGPTASGSPSRSLPPELIAEAGRRLAWVALVYAGALFVGHFGRRVLLAASGPTDSPVRASDLLVVLAAAMGVAVYLLSRSGRVPPRRLLDIGLAFEVVGALGIAAIPIVDRLPQIPSGLLVYVPAECIWIVVFPLVVPDTPGRALVASL